MWCIKGVRLIDYLWERGIKPAFEFGDFAFYHHSINLERNLERYYIQFVCIPNKIN